RLLADNDLKRAIVSGVVRRNGAIDFRLAIDVPLTGLDDYEVLAVAAHEGRVLLSHDVSTMRTHFERFVQGEHSPGLILIPQDLSIGAAIESILLLCEACETTELANKICLLPSLAMYGF